MHKQKLTLDLNSSKPSRTSTEIFCVHKNINMACLTFWSILGETLICNSDHIVSLISPTCLCPFPTPSPKQNTKALSAVDGEQPRNLHIDYPSHFCLN